MNISLNFAALKSARLLLAVAACCAVMQSANASEEFFVPIPEDQTLSFLQGIYSSTSCTTPLTSAEPEDPVTTVTDFVVRVDGTLIVVDHHEDGYEPDIEGIVDEFLPTAPVSATTRIYGDGILANGAAPGVTTDAGDVLIQGQVVVFDEDIITATQLNDVEITGAAITGGGVRTQDGLDGGDRVFSTETINLTRSQWADGPNTLLAGAFELFPTAQWGNSFTLPVGEDSNATEFEWTGFTIMAANDNTSVSVDANGDGDFNDPDDVNAQVINRGETVVVSGRNDDGLETVGGLNQGARVFSSDIVQVNVVSGIECQVYGTRWFTLFPDALLGNNYYEPVSTRAADATVIYLYNPSPVPIVVNFETVNGLQAPIAIPGGEVFAQEMPSDSGARFFTGTNSTFGAFTVTDEGGTVFDWGHASTSERLMGNIVQVGFAEGDDPSSDDDIVGGAGENSSPVWLIAENLVDTTDTEFQICVDIQGDGGPNTDPNTGLTFDFTFSIDRLESVRIYDGGIDTPNDVPAHIDDDQSGMQIFVCDGSDAILAAAWGQDPEEASPGFPAIDLGTTVRSVSAGVAFAGDTIFEDENGNGVRDPGERGIQDITVLLTPPPGINLGNGPGRPITATTDFNGSYLFPSLVDATYTLEIIPPAGFTPTVDPDEINGLSVIDITDNQTVFVIEDSSGRLDQDFGYQNAVAVGNVGNFIYNDVNGNGIQDAGETGIGGIDVELCSDIQAISAADDFSTIAFDNNSAQWASDWFETGDLTDFTGLPASANPANTAITIPGNGDFQGTGNTFVTGLDGVRVLNEAGGVLSIGGNPNQPSVTRAVNVGGPGTISITFDFNGTVNAGDDVELLMSTDGGVTFPTVLQTFSQAVQDNGQIGISFDPGTATTIFLRFQTVSPTALLDSFDLLLINSISVSSLTGVCQTQTTDSSGAYLFTGIPEGLVSVEVLNPPAGLVNTDDPGGDGDSSNTFSLFGSGGNLEQDFGYFQPAVVIGHVYLDANGNGVQDLGEANVPNLNVEITDSNGDLITVITDANGDYSAEVPAGSAQINLDTTDPDFPTGFIQTDGEDPTTVVAVAGSTVDAGDDGFFQGNVIGDTVYSEIDGVLGVQGVTDTGIPGVLVTITPPATIDLGAGLGVAITTVTDTNGNYQFVGLPDGSYTIDVAAPSGSTQTEDPDGGNDNQSTLTVFGGVVVDDQDFGYQNDVPQGEIGDTVYNDANGNGVQDAGELGIANINVQICGDLDDDNSTINTCREQLTDANGNYLFGDGGAGGAAIPLSDVGEVYTITVLNPPVGQTNSQDPDGGLPNFSQLSLSSAGGNLDQDFGYFQPGVVTGRLYIDSNGNGVQDAGEPGLAGVDVVITDSNGNQTVVVSDANGDYSADVAPGANVVVDVDETDPQFPANHVQTEGTDPTVITVVAGATVSAGNDGYAPAGEISGAVFFDQAPIGTFEPATDTGIAASVVTIFPPAGVDLGNGNGVAVTTTTDLNGNYSFGSLPDGEYTVTVTQPNNTNPTVDPNESGQCSVCDNTTTVTITNGSIVDEQDFGFESIAPSGQIGNTIFTDSNGNGVLDAGEPGIGGILVQLCGDLDGDDTTAETCRTETTDSNGQYLFGDGFLADGTTADATDTGLPGTTGTEDYTITILNPPAGQANTADPDGGTSNVAQLTLPSAISNLDQNFGYAETSTLTGTVWLDEDLDGILDTEETGITQAQVELLDENGVVIATTVTDANGHYSFPNVFPGDYTVEVTETTLPNGLTNTAGLGAGNLDPNPKPVSITAGQEVADVNFGYVPAPGTGAIGDRVWSDANGNGIQDIGEAGIEGVSVSLRDADGNEIAATTTNANGDYLFTGVAFATDLTVVVDSTTPELSGFTITEGPHSQGDVTSQPIELSQASTIETGIDFGFNNPLSNTINETVWFDDNADGVFDPNENSISGVFFNLFNDQNADGIPDDADGDGQPEVVATSLSDAAGNVSFTGVADGSFVVAIADSNQVLDGLNGTTAEAQASISNTVSVASGSTISSQSFGFNSPGLIAGTVYSDTSSNSDQEPGEAGLSGVVVTLTPPADVDLGNGLGQPITTLTESDGSYEFSVLPNETYTISVASPGGSETEDPDGGGDNTATVTVTSSESSTSNDFGYTGLNNVFDISGTVFFDNDSDGTIDLPQDTGIDGVTVELIDLNNINAFNIIDGMIDLNSDGVISQADDGTVEGVDIIDGMFDVNGDGVIDEDDTASVGSYDVLAGMVNLAQAGTANQSSTLGSFNANNGNDGDTLDFAHTDGAIANEDTATEYWQIDLGSNQDIADITVFNRDTVCCVGRLEGVVLMVADTPFPDASSDFSGALSNADFVQVLSVASANDPFVSVDLTGRFIRLQKAGGNTVNGVVIENFGNDAIAGGAGQAVINFAELKVTPSFIAATTDGVVSSVTADVNGDYSFTGLPDGNYRVVVTDDNAQLIGHELTSGLNERDVTVDAANVEDVDFGYVTEQSTGSIAGEVFVDGNADDVAADAETDLANVDVYLCTAPLLETGQTAPDGLITFERYDGNVNTVFDIENGALTQSTTVDTFEILAADTADAVNDFGYIYQGFITLDESGTYEFSTRSDDGSTLSIDGGLVVDNDGNHGPRTETATIDLDAGVHSIEVRFFEASGGQEFEVEYRTPSQTSLAAIPSSVLSTVIGVCSPLHPNFVAQTVTDANGEYIFNDLPADQYVVATDPSDIPTGLEQSTLDSLVNVTEGEDVTDVDIGHEEEAGTAVLSGFVWTDVDGDGEFDQGESPIPGVTINVFDTDGNIVATTVTDSTGNWIIADLPIDLGLLLVGYDDTVPSGLNLNEIQPTNLPFGDNQYFPIDLSPVDNRNVSFLDFGFQPTVSANLGDISGTIYSDVDLSDDYLATTDDELQNVTLNLFNSAGELVATTQTDNNGDYSFTGLQDDTYSIEISDINNVTQDLNANPLDVIDSAIVINNGNSVTDQDAGYVSSQNQNQLSIGSKFFFDENNNGQFDDGESGIGGVTIQCWLDTDFSETVNNAAAPSSSVVPQPGIDNLIRTVVTDDNGDYVCPSLPEGQYIVRVFDAGDFNEADDGTTVSGSDADNQAKNWSYALTLSATEPNFAADFGIAGDNSISGFIVIEDMDLVEPLLDDGLILGGTELDGVRGGPSNDTPAGGVSVDLLVEQNGVFVVLQSTVTASDGSYTFDSLPDGNYQVVVNPDGSVIDGFGQTGDPSLFAGLNGNGEEDLVCDSPTAALCDDQSDVINLAGGTTVEDVDFAYQRDFATTPVTMTYFTSEGDESGITFNWETGNEIGHAGFQIYAHIDGQWTLITDLIGSEPGSALKVRQYEYRVSGIDAKWFALIDVSSQEEVTPHGPFKLGEEYGQNTVELAPFDWSQIERNEPSKEEVSTSIDARLLPLLDAQERAQRQQ